MKREEIARALVSAAKEIVGTTDVERHAEKALHRVNSTAAEMKMAMESITDAQDSLVDEAYDEELDQKFVDAWNALAKANDKVVEARKVLNLAMRKM